MAQVIPVWDGRDTGASLQRHPRFRGRGLGGLLILTVANSAGGRGLPNRMVGAGEPFADE